MSNSQWGHGFHKGYESALNGIGDESIVDRFVLECATICQMNRRTFLSLHEGIVFSSFTADRFKRLARYESAHKQRIVWDIFNGDDEGECGILQIDADRTIERLMGERMSDWYEEMERAEQERDAMEYELSLEYKRGREEAEEEHRAMCENCIHKVSKDDIDAVYKRGREDTLAEILKLPRLDRYDMWNELMYQSIRVDDIERLRKPREDSQETEPDNVILQDFFKGDSQ